MVAVLSLGCVSRGTHNDLVVERDWLSRNNAELSEQITRLEASKKSLDVEIVELHEAVEDLTIERDSLRGNVAALQRSENELAQTLEEREAELAEQAAKTQELRSTYRGLIDELESEVASGQIEIQQLREGLRVNVSDEILFSSGSAVFNLDGQAVLERVGERLRDTPYRIEIQGHTDNFGIRGLLSERYPTNWELAGARAARVVRLFADQGIAGERLRAVSYAEFHPVAPNDTPENRALNRRIEIRLLPALEDGASENAASGPGLPAPTEAGDSSGA